MVVTTLYEMRVWGDGSIDTTQRTINLQLSCSHTANHQRAMRMELGPRVEFDPTIKDIEWSENNPEDYKDLSCWLEDRAYEGVARHKMALRRQKS